MPIFKQRRGTAAALAAANETPAAGQIYFETDTARIKVGDGTTAYNSLPFVRSDIASVTGLQSALNSKQPTGSYVLSTDSRLSDARTPLPHTHAITGLSDVTMNNVSDGDVVRYSSGKWRNYPESNLVDGGNF